jgi:hypothetical protein
MVPSSIIFEISAEKRSPTTFQYSCATTEKCIIVLYKMHPPVRAAHFTKQLCNDTTVWKRDMELVTAEFEVFGRVSYQGRLAYGRQDAIEASGWYLEIPKFSGCT